MLPAATANLGKTYDLCIIETAPSSLQTLRQLFQVADLVIVPVYPQATDLWALGAVLETIRDAGKPHKMVVTRAASRTKSTTQAIAAPEQTGNVCSGRMHYRIVFGDATIAGKSVLEMSDKKAAEEVAAVWSEIKGDIR